MTQEPVHPWRQPRELDDLFLYQLALLTRVTGTMVVRLCEGGYGVTRREWLMLGLLAVKGPLQPSQLAEHAQLDRTRTSRTVSALIVKGLLQKQAIAGDARQAMLQLTPAGQQLYEQLFPQVQSVNQQLLQGISEQELQTVARLLARVRERAEAMQQSEVFPKTQRRQGRRL